ncbi:hypothetical protein [Tsukamurella sp. 1534]|uniref:hypothetical protein n=1 Tax=Tsukamurella sp. 1534 TaxID=1151061 RepID=UPI0002DBF7E4|nr:hypothetical protein [Tsukamurella sp. 1534]
MRTTALTVLRCLALLVLFTGFASAATASQPRSVQYEDFARDLDRGAVELIVLEESSSTGDVSGPTAWIAVWSTGPFQWRRGPVVEGNPVPLADFTTLMRDRGVRVAQEDDDENTIVIAWPFEAPAWFGTLLGLTWLATFLAMLSSRPRWGNRWAWFWMFVIGQVGVLLYLLVEPAPLWRRQHDEHGPSEDTVAPWMRDPAAPDEPPSFTPVPPGSLPPEPAPDTRVSGGTGCLYSIVTSIGAAVLAGVLGWAAGHVLP